MPIELLRSLVWLVYRLALLFGVFMPLTLLIWSVAKNAKFITHLLIIYWRVASLLGITVYLLLDQNPIGFATGFASLVLIPLSLWFWVDLNEEIEDRRDALKIGVMAWRWAISIFCVLSALLQLPYLRCAASKTAVAAAACQAWLEPPLVFKEILHAETRAGKLGFLAIAALMLYGLYFGYFVIFRLTKQGRSASGI